MLTNFLNYFTYNVGLLQKYKTLGLIGFKSLKSCTILSWETYSYISGFGFKFILFKSIQELIFIHLSNILLDTAVLFCSIQWLQDCLKYFTKKIFVQFSTVFSSFGTQWAHHMFYMNLQSVVNNLLSSSNMFLFITLREFSSLMLMQWLRLMHLSEYHLGFMI